MVPGTWRLEASTRRSTTEFRLVALEQRQLRTVSLELWLGIEGKHVAFLELWLRMTSFELWLGMADEHEHSLSCGSDWRVLPVCGKKGDLEVTIQRCRPWITWWWPCAHPICLCLTMIMGADDVTGGVGETYIGAG
ncbi:hypothetical protein DEO72_LG6g1618 [Vigna unguiculata]|uniref:Uncharacterized protein n=1 Tax=Vigna unguiculata TaxID=3917 RepID=A0A4D6M8S6_VIGUN|nr:hypothetical protein DEO72_LG6g1618 [Vigna unguiculata]